MTRVAWVVAVFAIVGAFVFVRYAEDRLQREMRDAQKALEEQRLSAEEALNQARLSLEDMRSNFLALESGTVQVQKRHQEVKQSWEQLQQSIEANDRAIEKLEAERLSAKHGKQRDLDEIKELKDKIGNVEKQIEALTGMMGLVDLNEEDI